jgi:hypothetical protein
LAGCHDHLWFAIRRIPSENVSWPDRPRLTSQFKRGKKLLRVVNP